MQTQPLQKNVFAQLLPCCFTSSAPALLCFSLSDCCCPPPPPPRMFKSFCLNLSSLSCEAVSLYVSWKVMQQLFPVIIKAIYVIQIFIMIFFGGYLWLLGISGYRTWKPERKNIKTCENSRKWCWRKWMVSSASGSKQTDNHPVYPSLSFLKSLISYYLQSAAVFNLTLVYVLVWLVCVL